MISNFAKALQSAEYTQTRNGALSLSTPDNAGQSYGRLSLFFKGNRNINLPLLYDLLKKSSNENLLDTFCLVFNLRDCRGGKGERNLGRKALIWLFLNFPKEFDSITHLLPEYGRWDDIISLWPSVLDISITNLPYLCQNYCVKINGIESINYLQEIQKKLVKMMGDQLILDKYHMELGIPITLCAKWAPTQKDYNDINYNVVKTLCSTMKWSFKEYRKVYLSPLRAYLKIVERFMCNKDWKSIDFSKVPSNAMKRLKNAFLKNTPGTFDQWKRELILGNNTINAKQLFPHEIVAAYMKKGYYDSIYEEQWKVLENNLLNKDVFSNALCIIDVSGSMEEWDYYTRSVAPNNFKPIDVALALGIIISKSIQGIFNNHVITFSEEPSFSLIPNYYNLYDKLCLLKKIDWGGSTNLIKTFELILKKATFANLAPKDMPEKIFIISDMQFNSCGGKTNFQTIDQQYKFYGYKRPKIIFWNVNGSTNDFPVSVDDNDTALVSGFSTSVIKSIFSTANFCPYNVMKETINDSRYDPLRNSLLPLLQK